MNGVSRATKIQFDNVLDSLILVISDLTCKICHNEPLKAFCFRPVRDDILQVCEHDYLLNCSWEFQQSYQLGAVGDKDKLVRF